MSIVQGRTLQKACAFSKDVHEFAQEINSKGVAGESVEIKFGANIKDWPAMVALTGNLMLKVVSEIHDPVTTTDELISPGETSSYRSDPLGFAEFTLSRKDPAYVGRTKENQAAEKQERSSPAPYRHSPSLRKHGR